MLIRFPRKNPVHIDYVHDWLLHRCWRKDTSLAYKRPTNSLSTECRQHLLGVTCRRRRRCWMLRGPRHVRLVSPAYLSEPSACRRHHPLYYGQSAWTLELHDPASKADHVARNITMLHPAEHGLRRVSSQASPDTSHVLFVTNGRGDQRRGFRCDRRCRCCCL